MKIRRASLVLIVTLSLGSSLVGYAQESSGATTKRPRTPADYQTRTIKELTAAVDKESTGNKEETMTVTPHILPSRVRVTYTGSVRELPEIKKEVLRQWARLYAGFPEGYTEPYQSEMLFIEDGKEHWLAVRTTSLPQLKQQLKKRDVVDLFLIRVGTARVSKEWELMLLIESFSKPENNPGGSGQTP
jgi:hypothetical protein